MKKLVLLVAAMIIVGITNAQVAFQKAYKGSFVATGWMTQQTIDGGYIITGWNHSGVNNDHNVYLIKTNSTGDTLWTKWYGGIESDIGTSVQQTEDNGYIITGYTLSINGINTDVLLIKTNSIGDTLWTKGFNSTGDDFGYNAEQTSDGGFVFAGHCFNGNFLAKTDSAGNLLWSNSFSADYWLKFPQIHQTNDGGYIFTCDLDSFGNTNVYLIKTNSSGMLLWSKTYDLGGSDHGFAVRQTADGGYIINGATVFPFFDSYNYLLKTDSVGNALWAKVFGGAYDEYGFDVRQTSDGGYVTTGRTGFGSGNGDVYFVRTDSFGNLLWSRTYDAFGADEGHSVQQTLDDGYIIAGSGTAAGSVYLIKIDSAGNSGCNQYSPLTIVTTPTIITATPTTVFDTLNFIVSSTGFAIGSGSNINNLCTTGIDQPTLNDSILISPNPTSGIFTVSTSDKFQKGNIEIYTALGKLLYSDQLISNSTKEINLLNSSKGIYFVKVFNGEKGYCKKLIIE